MEQIDFYKPFESNDFFYERCFLCGCDFSETIRTDEHIFPKWLLHKFDLWNYSLRILNNTDIQYRYLTVPCCEICNNTYLSQMENKFQKLLDNKFKNLTESDEVTIFQWTAKILYSTLYKELSLKLDRKNSNLGTIISPSTIEGFGNLHLLLQSIRIKTEFQFPKPWSIFIFNYEDDTFHYLNDVPALCFSIKLGNIGITIAFEDNNEIEHFLSLMKNLNLFKLNYVQFLEISSRIFYAKRLSKNTPRYLISYNKSTGEMSVRTLNVLRNEEWDDKEFAFIFEQILEKSKISIGRPLYKDGTINTYLVDNDGELMINKIKNRS